MQEVIKELGLHNPLLRGNPIEGYILRDHAEEWLVVDRDIYWLREYTLNIIKEDPFTRIDLIHNEDYYAVYMPKEKVLEKYAVLYAKMACKLNKEEDPKELYAMALEELEDDPIGFLCEEYNRVQKPVTGKDIDAGVAFKIWSEKMVDLEETFKRLPFYLDDPIECLKKLGYGVVKVNNSVALRKI